MDSKKKKTNIFFKETKQDYLNALLFFIFALSIALITAALMEIESYFGFTVIDNDWIGFYGNLFGSLLGVLITIYIFKIKDHKSEKEENIKFNLYLKQYRHYLLKTFLKVKSIEKRLNNKIEYKKYNRDDLTFYEIENVDYSELLIQLNMKNIISSDVIDNNIHLEMNIENFNRSISVLAFDFSLSKEELIDKYKEFFSEEIILKDSPKNKVIAVRYNHLIALLIQINENIETLKKEVDKI